MTYVVQAEKVQDHGVPVVILQLVRNMPCHVIVHLRKVLIYIISLGSCGKWLGETYSNEEAGSTIRSIKQTREQLEPRVVSI